MLDGKFALQSKLCKLNRARTISTHSTRSNLEARAASQQHQLSCIYLVRIRFKVIQVEVKTPELAY